MTKEILLSEIKKTLDEIKRIERKIDKLEGSLDLKAPYEAIVVTTKYVTFQISEAFIELSKADAKKFVAELNKSKYLGYDDWRLPSYAECFMINEISPILRHKKYYTHVDEKYLFNHDKAPGLWISDGIATKYKQAIFIRNVKEYHGQAND